MTNAIEKSKAEMYEMLSVLREFAKKPVLCAEFESYLEKYLELLRQELESLRADNSRGHAASLQDQASMQSLRQERDDLRNRVQVLESANKIAGERMRVITEARETLSAISHHEYLQNVASEVQKANALMIILGALVDSQRIVTDWLVPDGIRPKKAMSRLVAVLDNEVLFMAIRSFENPEIKKGSPCDYCDGLGYIHCNGGRPTAPCPNGCQ